MEDKNITKYEFVEELKQMAVSCIGVKENTAKKKVSNIIEKYGEIISYSKIDHDYYKIAYDKYRKMFETLKSGVVYYYKGETQGVMLIKDIEQIEVRKNDVLIITKTGREITLGLDFKFLKDIF